MDIRTIARIVAAATAVVLLPCAVPDRRAVVFRLAIPPDSLKPGLYTCQLNIIDGVSGRFAFPRFEMFVR